MEKEVFHGQAYRLQVVLSVTHVVKAYIQQCVTNFLNSHSNSFEDQRFADPLFLFFFNYCTNFVLLSVSCPSVCLVCLSVRHLSFSIRTKIATVMKIGTITELRDTGS